MKGVVGLVLGLFLLLGCTSTDRMLKVRDENLIDISQKDEEHELIVLDPGFDTWFLTSWSPAKDRSVEYYSLWNKQYVSAWNYKSMYPHTSKFFDNVIQYDLTINYGIEVERKLYYYFRWVDSKLGIPILDTRPPGRVL